MNAVGACSLQFKQQGGAKQCQSENCNQVNAQMTANKGEVKSLQLFKTEIGTETQTKAENKGETKAQKLNVEA